jgi:TolB-like protein
VGISLVAILIAAGGTWFVMHTHLSPQRTNPGAKTVSPLPAALPERIQSLAVLPLANFSGDSNQDYFADGLTDELSGRLAQISALKKVISRTTMTQYKGTKKSIPEIAREVGVDAIVEGSVVVSGSRVSIKVQLIEAARDKRLWSNSYERESADIIQLQNEVTLAIAQAIKLVLAPNEEARLAQARAVKPEAFDLYLRGKYLTENECETNNLAAIELFKRSVEIDPGFAAGYAELASACIMRYYRYEPEQYRRWEGEAFAGLTRVFSLDQDCADGYFVRGRMLWTPVQHFKHEEAVADLRHAVRLNPSSGAHRMLGVIYGHCGLLDEGLAEAQKAKALDPLGATPLLSLAYISLWKGEYNQALQLWPKIPRDGMPFLVGSHHAWTLFALHHTNEARARLDQYLQDLPADSTGELAGMRAVLLAAAGDAAGAEAQLQSAMKKETRYGEFHHTAYFIASAYALMNRPKEALAWVEKTADTGFPCYPLFVKDPNLDSLRGNAEFVSFLEAQRQQWQQRKDTWLEVGDLVRTPGVK